MRDDYLQKLPKSLANNYSTIAMSLFLLGLCGFLPFMTTLEQRGWYLYPSLLLFMLALSIIILPYVDKLFSQLKQKHLVGIKKGAIVMLVVVLGVTLFLSGKPKRDASVLHDIKIIQKTVPVKGRISIQKTAIQTDLESIIYFERYAKIALIRNSANEPYYLTLKGEALPAEVTGYKKYGLATLHYDLYSK